MLARREHICYNSPVKYFCIICEGGGVAEDVSDDPNDPGDYGFGGDWWKGEDKNED